MPIIDTPTPEEREQIDRDLAVHTLIVPVPPELAADWEAFDCWRIEVGAGLFDFDPAITRVKATWNRAAGLAEFTAFGVLLPTPGVEATQVARGSGRRCDCGIEGCECDPFEGCCCDPFVSRENHPK